MKSPHALPVEAARARRVLEPEIRRVLQRAHDAACATHSRVALSFDVFAHDVLQRIARRLEAAGVAADPAGLRSALAVTCLPDLHLAVACEHDVDGAWDALCETYAPRIDALARSIGMPVDVGTSVGRDLLADLALPPASGSARTRLGTYEGTGSLFAWLAVVLRRHGATRARRKTSPPAPVEPAALDTRRGPDTADPYAAVIDAEEGQRIVLALQAAWRSLSTREQLALHFKYGESLRLKEIGVMLGLSESGTSRLVKGGLDRMRAHVRPMIEDGRIAASRVGIWAALWQAVRPGAGDEEGAR